MPRARDASVHGALALEIRPIAPDDAARLQAGYARLSSESRYHRFLSAKPILTAADARYLADVDGVDHVALVATVSGDGAEDSIVAVARFIRLPDDPVTAEFAIIVGDDYQRQGLATALLERLAVIARERGITRFRATTLSGNVAVHRLIEHLSESGVEAVHQGSTTEVQFELPASIAGSRGAIIGTCAGS